MRFLARQSRRSLDPACFPVAVRGSVSRVLLRELLFQFAVGCRFFGMTAKIVAEREMPMKRGVVLGADVQMVVGQVWG